MWGADGFMWGGMMGGGLMMILFWGGLIVLIVLAIQAIARSSSKSSEQSNGSFGATEKSALEILKERYARGEISQAEYQEIHKIVS